MNRLTKLFDTKKSDLLAVYATAGFPFLDSTVPVITSLAEGGVDLIEVGIPFSDPMADGPVIQNSSTVALRNGMTLKKLFSQIAEARKLAPEIPIVLMGYLNPIICYGLEDFFKKCVECGIDGVIIPDLPFADYMRDVKPLSSAFGVDVIMMITPETSDERIRLIDENCSGFIYMVSSASTTGARDSFSEAQVDYFRHVNSLDLNHARMIGFGISNVATYNAACRYASGAIIGSQFIKLLSDSDSPREAVTRLLERIGRE